MFTIYRIEDEHGVGPYQGHEVSGIDICVRRSRPTPYEDGLPQELWYPDRVFGFRSMDDLLSWFDHYDLEVMEENGYSVVIYRVQDDQCFLGKRQVCFSKEYAVCMGDAQIPQLV